FVFLFSGAVAGVAGGLFASLQSYITPDAFTFDLSVLFFIAILIGGRGSVLGPLLATLILTALPEFAAPLVAWSTFLYAALLLVIVLLAPGGIAALIDVRNRRPLAGGGAGHPRRRRHRPHLPDPADRRRGQRDRERHDRRRRAGARHHGGSAAVAAALPRRGERIARARAPGAGGRRAERAGRRAGRPAA